MKERDPSNQSNQATEFAPLAGKLNSNMVTHSAGEEETAYMWFLPGDKPYKAQDEPIAILIAETDLLWSILDWVVKGAAAEQDLPSKFCVIFRLWILAVSVTAIASGETRLEILLIKRRSRDVSPIGLNRAHSELVIDRLT